MSLILGLHLSRRLYLVSDTRRTVQHSDGSKKFHDDLIKAFVINRQIQAVAAGRGGPAAYILKELRKRVDNNTTISQLKDTIAKKLEGIVSNYVNKTGKYGYVTLIIAGFNPEKNKKVESSALGNAMSAELVAKGNGSMIHQNIDTTITNALFTAINQNGTLQKGMYVELKDIPDSEMLAITVDLQTNKYTLEVVDCYKFVVFHPNQDKITLDIPPELISSIEFGQRQSTDLEDILYEDAAKIMSFTNKLIKKYQFTTVGGHIFPIVVSQDGFIFPTGDIATIKNGQVAMIGSVFVDKDGVINYKLEDGQEGKYKFVENLDDSELELLEF